MLFSAKAISFLASLVSIPYASASVTVYSQLPFGKPSTTAPSFANYTAASAFDPTNLKAPSIPSPPPGNKFNIQVAASNSTQNGLSITTAGSFFGFSVEMSVANQVCMSLTPIIILIVRSKPFFILSVGKNSYVKCSQLGYRRSPYNLALVYKFLS